MNTRTLIVCSTGLLAMLAGPYSYGRGIRVDFTSADSRCAMQPDSPGVPLLDYKTPDALAGSFKPLGAASPTAECFPEVLPISDQDSNSASSANFYLWGPALNLSAQVVDYTLSTGDLSFNGSSIGGLTEIEFNYPSSCSSAAKLIWGATTYSAPCNDGSGNSPDVLLFMGSSLSGYLDSSDNFTAGLAGSGWTAASASVPEPDTLGLLGCAAIPMLLLFRRRLRCSAPASR